MGLPVKRVKGGFALKAKAKPRLIRKEGSVILDSNPIML